MPTFIPANIPLLYMSPTLLIMCFSVPGGRIGDHLTPAYLKSACETVRRRSTETAVTFLYLPVPPGQHFSKFVLKGCQLLWFGLKTQKINICLSNEEV